MKVLFERLLEAECKELKQLGIEISIQNLSHRLRSLASPVELSDALERWVARHNTSVEKLVKAGFSQPIIDIFTKPVR